jgi:hypothetical protein
MLDSSGLLPLLLETRPRSTAMNSPSSSPLLADELLQQLQGAPMQQIAQQLGTSATQTQSAVEMALPMLLGAMGRNTGDDQGAQALFGALQRDHMPNASASQAQAQGLGGLGGLLGGLGGLGGGSGGGGMDLGGLLGAVLGGGAAAGARGAGAAPGLDAGGILGHILGGNRERAESGLGQASGLGANAGQLLQILAPIVMSFLAKRVQAGGMDAGGLGQMLGQERTQAQSRGTPGGDLLGNLLDQDGDGQVGLSDLIKIGGSLLGGRR